MDIVWSKRFHKKMAKLPSSIRQGFLERTELFMTDPSHPLLNNHALHGKYAGRRSINITGDYRLIFEVIGAETVHVLDIDTHHNLYGT